MAVATQLSNLQQELLKLYAREVSDEDLLEIKKMISRYFGNKATEMADQFWDSNNWNSEKEEELLNTRMRTPYNSK